jgi:hypothetical protein
VTEVLGVCIARLILVEELEGKLNWSQSWYSTRRWNDLGGEGPQLDIGGVLDEAGVRVLPAQAIRESVPVKQSILSQLCGR